MPVLSLSDEITDLRLTDAKCMYVLIYFSKFIALSHYEKYIEQTCRFCSYQGSAKFSSSPGIASGFKFLRRTSGSFGCEKFGGKVLYIFNIEFLRKKKATWVSDFMSDQPCLFFGVKW